MRLAGLPGAANLLILVLLSAPQGCRRDRIVQKAPRQQPPAAQPRAKDPAAPAGHVVTPGRDSTEEPSAQPAPVTSAPGGRAVTGRARSWIVDEPARAGPAGPATATSLGVILNSKDGDLFLARLGPLSGSPRPVRTPVAPIDDQGAPFALGRGPSVFQDAAYWISRGSLVRRRLTPQGTPGPLEVLAGDAHDGTRVAVPLAAPGRKAARVPPMAAYIVRPPKDDAPLVARLWVEGMPSVVLTAEGNSTHSVSLVLAEEGVLAVSVQARMAMTPVHARRIYFSGGRATLGEDTVVWVGGGIQPLTEMTTLPGGEQDLWGFLPHERSIQEFGIARLDIGMNPDMSTRATWMLYPNGIDPAPVAAAHLCGEPVLLHAQPLARAPDSPAEVVLRPVVDPGDRRVRLAEGSAFYFVSLATLDGGALATWVRSDGTTMASTVRCGDRHR